LPFCKGRNHSVGTLIEAHIIPRAFARKLLGSRPNMQISAGKTREANPQLGLYDRDILCADCDQILGQLDAYAVDTCRRFRTEHEVTSDNRFLIRNVDGDRFAKFVLAVLWRASVSTRPELRSVQLQKYENMARGVLFDNEPLRDFTAFRLFIQRYAGTEPDPSGVYTMPVQARVFRRRGYRFALAGFRIMAVLDDWPLHAATPFSEVINGSNSLAGRFVAFEQTAEFRSLVDIVVAEALRRGVPPWELRPATP
jgi:hypothetical protein